VEAANTAYRQVHLPLHRQVLEPAQRNGELQLVVNAERFDGHVVGKDGLDEVERGIDIAAVAGGQGREAGGRPASALVNRDWMN
jgi:hypothetical protein